MLKSEYPKIVILSHHPMSTDSAAGLAIRSFFKGWDQERLTHIFTPTVRWGHPDFEACKDYRRVKWSGRVIPVAGERSTEQTSSAIGGSLVKRLAGLRSVQKAFLPLRAAWLTRTQYAKGIQNELAEIAPDVVYVMANSLYLAKATCIACENLDIPVCVHVVDDIVAESVAGNKKSKRRGIETEKWFKRLAQFATTHIGISPQMAAEYTGRYGCDWSWFTTLTDPDGYDPSPRKAMPEEPVKFVFAGNLSYNRWREVCQLGVALRQLRVEGILAELIVYGSPAHFKLYGNELRAAGVEFREWVPVDELGSVFHNADVLVHVESCHDPKMRQAIRLSLSTKISQYMMAGRPIIAIGPSELASIQFIRDSNAGVIFDVEKSDDLIGCIRNMICERSRLERLGANGRILAMSVFEGESQRKRFRQLILETIQKHHRRK